MLLELARQALRGGREVSVRSQPHGFLPQASLGFHSFRWPCRSLNTSGAWLQAGADFAQRLSARWAYCGFLLGAGGEANPQQRLVITVAFMVAGLHLAVAGFPYLPWLARTSVAPCKWPNLDLKDVFRSIIRAEHGMKLVVFMLDSSNLDGTEVSNSQEVSPVSPYYRSYRLGSSP